LLGVIERDRASVTVAKGTCGSALSTTSMPTVSLATANAITSDTPTTFTTTAGQCINFRIAKTSFAAAACGHLRA
jgi:hypothetical protein